MTQRIRIATRKSKLAMQQANYIRILLQRFNRDLEVEILGVVTTGDKSAQDIGFQMSGKGDFLKEIETELFAETADLAIHSMKDVPAQLPDGLTVSAIGPRLDPTDALAGIDSLSNLPANARIGTSSSRRRALLRHVYKKTNVQPVRGNVDTRLQKLDHGKFDALVLATSGLLRLGLDNRIGTRLNPSIFVPAAGQGQLAVEYRNDDDRIKKLVSTLEVPDTSLASYCERDVVNELGADCTTPIGVYCEPIDQGFHILCIVLDSRGEHSVKVSFFDESPSKLAKKAVRSLLSMGARDLFEAA
ncbi:MAG: hydroxymethylbilane synthase [Gammaproteobacteria bacterium]|nr:hydroxymethylbilane synthase [Gammaproteobacteria bacterium]